jgi:hypothetical protein
LALGIGQTAVNDPRPPHPLAPSLPRLTPKEIAKYDAVVDRFIQFDTGKLPGSAGKKAQEEFNRLPPESIFILIDGFNRTANMEASCPAVVIGKKIIKILNASEDLELLAFAKENLGVGVTAKRHLGMLKDVQFSILLRKGAVQRKLAASGGSASPGSMSLDCLVKASETKKGVQLKSVLVELEKRQGPLVFQTLAIAAASPEKDLQNLGAGLLDKHMGRQKEAQLKALLKHERPEVRAAAAREIGKRGLLLGKELIDLLQDNEPFVGQAARAALAQLSGGLDYGPAPDASLGEREAAVRRWRDWLLKKTP